MTEEQWFVTCARCKRTIKGERSRLMWGRLDGVTAGTYRLCGPMLQKKCDRLYNEEQREKTRSGQ
jgi:hypothetical protein